MEIKEFQDKIMELCSDCEDFGFIEDELMLGVDKEGNLMLYFNGAQELFMCDWDEALGEIINFIEENKR